MVLLAVKIEWTQAGITGLLTALFTIGIGTILGWITGYLKTKGDLQAQIEKSEILNEIQRKLASLKADAENESRIRYAEDFNSVQAKLEEIKTQLTKKSQIEVAHRNEERSIFLNLYSNINTLLQSLFGLNYIFTSEASSDSIEQVRKKLEIEFFKVDSAFVAFDLIVHSDDLIATAKEIVQIIGLERIKLDMLLDHKYELALKREGLSNRELGSIPDHEREKQEVLVEESRLAESYGIFFDALDKVNIRDRLSALALSAKKYLR
jgi:hypothetical protein